MGVQTLNRHQRIHHELITLVQKHNCAAYVAAVGSLKHYEVSFRRWLKANGVNHLITISNQKTMLVIWLTSAFRTKHINDVIKQSITTDNTIVDEARRPQALALEELMIKFQEKEVVQTRDGDPNRLLDLAKAQYKRGKISKEKFDEIKEQIQTEGR